MNKFIGGIEAQPRYPHEDLTETNADMAELLILGSTLREGLHEASEAVSLSSRLGHTSIMRIASDTYEQSRRIDAIDHGVSSFEAIKALVLADVKGSIPTVGLTSKALLLLKGISYERHVDTAVELFVDTMPRTKEVINASSRTLYGHLTDYAIIGAALAWKFEKDASVDEVIVEVHIEDDGE